MTTPATPPRAVENVTTVLRQAHHWARALHAPGSPDYLDCLAANIRDRVINPMIANQPGQIAGLTTDNATLADEIARLQQALQRQTRVAEAAAAELAELRDGRPLTRHNPAHGGCKTERRAREPWYEEYGL